MSSFFNFNLIDFLDFYFSFLFFVGISARFQQYQRRFGISYSLVRRAGRGC